MRHVDRHAVQQEIVMLTCPGPEVFGLYFAKDIYKLIYYDNIISYLAPSNLPNNYPFQKSSPFQTRALPFKGCEYGPW